MAQILKKQFFVFWVCSFSVLFFLFPLVSPYFLVFHDILEPPELQTAHQMRSQSYLCNLDGIVQEKNSQTIFHVIL